MRCAGLMIILAAGTAIAAAGEERPGWLNVRELGASGSEFQTSGTTTASSNRVQLQAVGDFGVGQGVTVSRANIRYHDAYLWGPRNPYGTQQPLKDAVQMRGYDGSAGSWFVYILEVDGAGPATFRWSDDLARTWKQKQVPITFDWQPLDNKMEVKFRRQDWQPGHMITFSARDQWVSVVEKIEGNTLVLKDAANRAASDAVVRHSDHDAIQAAITRAIREKRNLFFPAGYYRIPGGLYVPHAAIQIEGAAAENTVLDIGDGNGSCFLLDGGREVTIRNFRMIGHTPLAESPAAFQLSNKLDSFWASAIKGCNAVSIRGTERVWVENVHASRMSSECFYSQGPARTDGNEPKEYTRSLTFLRCSVTDCCANAFNNNDAAENTSVLYCRVDGVGWQSYEGPGRFIKIIGNYVRNAYGGLWVGSMNARKGYESLGCGQAIIADNVIEGGGRDVYGIHVERGASEVVVANNVFVNFANNIAKDFTVSAIEVSSRTHPGLPAERVTVKGNIIDLTDLQGKPHPRVGINVSASGTIVSDNQVYVRGANDRSVIGISIAEPAMDVIVHDNLIRNCGVGLRTVRSWARVTEIIDPKTFLAPALPSVGKQSHLYRGWTLAWQSGRGSSKLSTIDAFDPDTLRVRLKEPCEMKVGDTFSVFPASANWNLHDNTISDCRSPVILDAIGGETMLFRNNMIARGEIEGVTHAVQVLGMAKLIGNHISGFDEKGSSALLLDADPWGRMKRNLYRDNIFERCTAVLSEGSQKSWTAANASGNAFLSCGQVPADK